MQKPDSDLTTSFRRLAETLQQLANSLRELAGTFGDPLYKSYNMPFGPSDEARKIWIRFRQYTTRN